MRRRHAALAGAVAVGAAGVAIRRLRRPHRTVESAGDDARSWAVTFCEGTGGTPHRRTPMPFLVPLRIAAAIAMLPALVLGIGWGPIHISGPWDVVFDAGEAAWNKVKDYVYDAIMQVVNWAIVGLDLAGRFLLYLTKAGLRALDQVENIVDNLIPNVLSQAWGWVGDAIRQINEVRQAAWNGFLNVANDISNLWDRVVQRIIQFGADLYNQINRELIGPIANWIWNSATLIGGWIEDHIGLFFRAVVAPLIADVRGLLDRVAEVYRWFLHVAVKVVTIVDECWDFLYYIATHPFTWWQDYANRLVNNGSTWLIDAVTQGVSANADAVDDRLASWLGR